MDTSFGCKTLPKPGNTDKCAANMAWLFNSTGHGPVTATSTTAALATPSPHATDTGALQAAFDPTLCLDVVGGGSLASCDASRAQQWTLKPPPSSTLPTEASDDGLRQLVLTVLRQ